MIRKSPTIREQTVEGKTPTPPQKNIPVSTEGKASFPQEDHEVVLRINDYLDKKKRDSNQSGQSEKKWNGTLCYE